MVVKQTFKTTGLDLAKCTSKQKFNLTALLEKLQHWRLLHVSQGVETTASHDTKFLRKFSKPKCDFEATAAALNKNNEK